MPLFTHWRYLGLAIVEAVQGVAGATACLTLTLCAFEWYNSGEIELYLNHIKTARKSRNLLRHKYGCVYWL